MNNPLLKGYHASTSGVANNPQSFALNMTKLLTNSVAVFFIGLLLCSTTSFSFVKTAEAAPRKGYEAELIKLTNNGDLSFAPRESIEIDVQFKNLGPNTWHNTGEELVSIYTYDDKYRISDFEHGWYSSIQPVFLTESSVAPGETGTISFTMTAPSRLGDFTETFHLAAEDTTWIPGGEFSFDINVSNGVTVITEEEDEVATEEVVVDTEPVETTADGTPSPISEDGLSASVFLRSQKSVTAEAGEEIDYTVGIKNTGTVTWTEREVRTNEIMIASAQSSETYHKAWLSSSRLVANTSHTVTPGALDFFKFTFTAPSTKGTHTVRYRLAANDTVIPDFYIDIPIEVTSGAAEAIDAPLLEGIELTDEIEEPVLRIGILIVDEETDWESVISCNSEWYLMDGRGAMLDSLAADESVLAYYDGGYYHYDVGAGIVKTEHYLRFDPKDDDAVCTIENFDRRITRNAGYADNMFRDILEMRYNSSEDRTWIINEIPMEEYLAGLAETSNVSHSDYQKTLVTIARTYATYHWERATKHADEYFHMTSYSDDQVYKGYEHEMRSPRIAQAVEETRGTIVTYEGRTAITPYFSRSDGRTRDWSEVWYGTVPWCQSVATPCDEGKALWGHGVGLSASAALCMAKNGEAWDDILEYFYQGIDLVRRWE